MNKLKKYPTPFAGVSLGVGGISLFWASLLSNPSLSKIVALCGAVIALCLLIPVIIKFIRHPALLLADLKHPTVGSVVPTMAMSAMLISHMLGMYSTTLAVTVWLAAVCFHILFFSFFAYYRLRNFNLNHVVPSWFVPPIGIVVACLTVPAAFLLPLAHILLVFGIVSYLILFPIVIYRLSLGDKIEDARKPTLAILAAPASLTLAGYLTIVAVPNPLLVIMLFSFAILTTACVYLILSHLLKLSFSPAYAALTFPLAIGATAMNKMSHWIGHQTMLHDYYIYFHVTALAEGIIALLVISYVLALTVRHIYSNIIINN